MNMDQALDRAAAAIAGADAILIGAGAGMGVDSGLPDFRGPQGFWRAYPPYERLGLHFSAVANPRWFVQDPELAWGFYGHRMGLYRRTEPHEGFAILRRWAERMPRGGFVYTSNVDGHFHRGGLRPGPDRRGPRHHRRDAVHGRLRRRHLPVRPVRGRDRRGDHAGRAPLARLPELRCPRSARTS